MPAKDLNFEMSPEDFVAQVAKIMTCDDTVEMQMREYGITSEDEKDDFRENASIGDDLEIADDIAGDLETVVYVARQMMEIRETRKQDTGYIEKNYSF